MNNVEQLLREILEGEGNSQEKLFRLYGKKLSYNNSAMYIGGMKLLIEKMNSLKNEGGAVDYGHEAYEVEIHADNSKTIRQDIYLGPGEEASPFIVMQKMGLDPLLWEIITCKIIKGHWDVTMKMENSEVIDGGVVKTSTPLTKRNRKYSVELRVKSIVGLLTFPQVLEAFKELDPLKVPEYKYKVLSPYKGLLFELPMMDFHFGKHAWAEETGADYDLKIAEALWCKTIDDFYPKISMFGPVELILFPIGQDFFHFDTPGVTTTAGTQLHSDSRWQKMFRKGVELLVWTVERLRKIARVEVLWVPGNHDQMLSYAAVVGLAQRYSETDSVLVDLNASQRKYRLFGKNLIGYTHGDKEGKRLDGLMQVEVPKLWAESIFREFHMGHLHIEITTTKNGIVFRRINAITATDAWHDEKGFLGSSRQAQAFLWDKNRGLQAILNSNVVERTEMKEV